MHARVESRSNTNTIFMELYEGIYNRVLSFEPISYDLYMPETELHDGYTQ